MRRRRATSPPLRGRRQCDAGPRRRHSRRAERRPRPPRSRAWTRSSARRSRRRASTPEDADFAFVTYGDDANAVALNAFRIPGVTEVAMEQLARLMSGAGTDVDAEIGDDRRQDGAEDLRRPDRRSGLLLRRRRHRLHRRRRRTRRSSSSCSRSSPDGHGRADRDLPERGGGQRAHRPGHGRRSSSPGARSTPTSTSPRRATSTS